MVKVEKLWGTEEWLVNDEVAGYCVKRMVLNPGYVCSKHFHEIKDETFYVVEGSVDLELNGRVTRLYPGDFQRIRPYEIHSFKTDSDIAVFIEASTFHRDDDVVRLEPSREL